MARVGPSNGGAAADELLGDAEADGDLEAEEAGRDTQVRYQGLVYKSLVTLEKSYRSEQLLRLIRFLYTT
jgi:hypothetical protein